MTVAITHCLTMLNRLAWDVGNLGGENNRQTQITIPTHGITFRWLHKKTKQNKTKSLCFSRHDIAHIHNDCGIPISRRSALVLKKNLAGGEKKDNTWTSKVVALCHLFTLKHHRPSSAIETAMQRFLSNCKTFFCIVVTKPQMFSCGLCTLLWRQMLTPTLI